MEPCEIKTLLPVRWTPTIRLRHSSSTSLSLSLSLPLWRTGHCSSCWLVRDITSTSCGMILPASTQRRFFCLLPTLVASLLFVTCFLLLATCFLLFVTCFDATQVLSVWHFTRVSAVCYLLWRDAASCCLPSALAASLCFGAMRLFSV